MIVEGLMIAAIVALVTNATTVAKVAAVNKMIKMLGLGRRLSRKKILRQFEKGKFLTDKDPAKLIQMFGSHAKPMSIETVQKVDEILERINGHDCTVCGAPTCKTFAEDVVKGEASLNECVLLGGDRAC